MSHGVAMPSWNIQTALPYLTGFTMADELMALAERHDDIVVLTAKLMQLIGR